MNELDSVKLIKDFGNIKKGTEGVIMLKHNNKNFEVEFLDKKGNTIDVVTISSDYLTLVESIDSIIYPYCIKYKRRGYINEGFTYRFTIDFKKKELLIYKTVYGTEKTNEQIYDLDEEIISYAKKYLEASNIDVFINMPEDKLKKFDCGYRDEGWWEECECYFEKRDKIKIKMSTIYKNSPFENFFIKVKEFYGRKNQTKELRRFFENMY